MVPGFGVYDIVALASGGVAAGGIFALERRRYLESRSRVALAPERFLDLLAVRQTRRAGRPTHEYRAKTPTEAYDPARTTGSRGRLRRRDSRRWPGDVVRRRRRFFLPGRRPAPAPSRARRGTSGPCSRRPSAGAPCIPAAAGRTPARRAVLRRILRELDLDRHDAQVLVVLLAEHVRAGGLRLEADRDCLLHGGGGGGGGFTAVGVVATARRAAALGVLARRARRKPTASRASADASERRAPSLLRVGLIASVVVDLRRRRRQRRRRLRGDIVCAIVFARPARSRRIATGRRRAARSP